MSTMYVISGDSLGRGDDSLGRRLMVKFFLSCGRDDLLDATDVRSFTGASRRTAFLDRDRGEPDAKRNT